MLPELSGHRGLPDHPGRIRRADRHADGQGLRARQGRRARARRRRLRHEAVQPARAVGADPGPVPARPSRRVAVDAAAGRSSTSGAVQVDLGGPPAPARRRGRCRSSRRRSSCSPSSSATRARSFTRDQLLEHVWGYDYAGETRTVDVHVHWLRSRARGRRRPTRVHPHGPRRRLRVPPPGLRAPRRGAAARPAER